MPVTPVLPGGIPAPPLREQPPPPPRSSNSPRREVAPGTPCAGGAVSTRALRLRQARPGGLCCGSVPPACVGCVAGAVCRASARVRGRLGAVTVQRWLRGEGWHGGAALSPSSPPRRSGGCRRTSVCLVPPSVGVNRLQRSMRLCLSLWCGVMGRGLVNQWHFFVPWVMDGPRMRQKDEAAGAKQRAWLCWGLSSAGEHRAVTTSRTLSIALLLTAGTTSVGC